MIKHLLLLACLLIATAAPRPAAARTPSPAALATAHELVTAAHAAENLKALLPTVIQHMKPLIVQGRPQVEKDFDAIIPVEDAADRSAIHGCRAAIRHSGWTRAATADHRRATQKGSQYLS